MLVQGAGWSGRAKLGTISETPNYALRDFPEFKMFLRKLKLDKFLGCDLQQLYPGITAGVFLAGAPLGWRAGA
jgi:hypothetical protein